MRAWGADWPLPWVTPEDELGYVGRAMSMVKNGDLNPYWFINPTLVTYVLAAQYWLLGALGTLLGWLPGPADFGALPDRSWPLRLGRLESAGWGAAAVWAT